MDQLAWISVTLLLLVPVALAIRMFRRITVYEYERGVEYAGGKYTRTLNPGTYWVFAPSTTIKKVDIRPRYESITGQELLSADHVGLKVSLAAKYEIADPYAALNGVQSYSEALYLELQLALREIVGATEIDALLERRNEIGARLYEKAEPPLRAVGLSLLSVDVKDIMFPGDLKRMFAQVVNARKEGQAALERARGETAALRSLANAARMVQDNPALMQLRLLQVIGEKSGNTVVMGTSSVTPIPAPRAGESAGRELPPSPGDAPDSP
ncbi:MAG: slipin family protein [Armatimonadetes bacterium]|nr:slipin family protein [Armatimonadota bacterium]